MKCPHCLQSFHGKFPDDSSVWNGKELGSDVDGNWVCIWALCPACKRFIIFVQKHTLGSSKTLLAKIQVNPKGTVRPLPPEVPHEYTSAFTEACNVLPESAKASAALSRRCLQHLLREKAGVKHASLADEIETVLSSSNLPSYLAEAIDGVRNIGNFAAHPMKSTNTGEIVDVEPGEAEWLLETLEGLFDFYFVQPEKLKQKRAALDKKLKDAGKPPMK